MFFSWGWDYWELYHKITIDAPNKLIYVNEGVDFLDIKEDVYSSIKEVWVKVSEYYRYTSHPFPIRTVGGDPINEFLNAGDTYFLINGWRIVADPTVTTIQGVLYSDDFDTAWLLEKNGQFKPFYPNLVSSLVQTAVIEVPATVVAEDIRIEMDTNSTRLASIDSKPSPGTLEIAEAVRAELTPEMTKISLLENGLTETQATMLSEIYALYGLDPTKPLVVTNSSRSAGAEVTQTIVSDNTTTTVTRNT